jgi:hypothetical protein
MNIFEPLVARYDIVYPQIYFMVATVNPNPKGPLDSSIVMSMQRVLIANTKSYDSVEELLDAKILVNANKYSVTDLKLHIMRDTRRQPAIEIGDFVVYTGKQLQDRPIAALPMADGVRYFAHPYIEDMVKRK